MVCVCIFFLGFFFKQKTAYEMRISDWSSDVCSSDLVAVHGRTGAWRIAVAELPVVIVCVGEIVLVGLLRCRQQADGPTIGRQPGQRATKTVLLQGIHVRLAAASRVVDIAR